MSFWKCGLQNWRRHQTFEKIPKKINVVNRILEFPRLVFLIINCFNWNTTKIVLTKLYCTRNKYNTGVHHLIPIFVWTAPALNLWTAPPLNLWTAPALNLWTAPALNLWTAPALNLWTAPALNLWTAPALNLWTAPALNLWTAPALNQT